ncbi:hypothetical protein EGW08_015258, partial [Elysia chlorotica]
GGSQQNAPNLPYSVDPYEGFTRSRKSQQRAGRQNFSFSESPYRQSRSQNNQNASSGYRGQAGKSPSRNVTKVSSEKKGHDEDFGYRSVPASAWGPESKNASVADRLAGFLESQSPQMDKLANGVVLENKQRSSNSRNNADLDTFETKLAKYKNEAFSNQTSALDNNSDSDSDDEAVAKCNKENEDEEEENSFFGLQPEKTKLTALSEEEGETKFMSTVAAEKARVEKIRRARNAAEVIQRQWRRFRPRQ